MNMAGFRWGLPFPKFFSLKASILFLSHNPCNWGRAKTNEAELPFGSNCSISSQAVRFMSLWDIIPKEGLTAKVLSNQTELLAQNMYCKEQSSFEKVRAHG